MKIALVITATITVLVFLSLLENKRNLKQIEAAFEGRESLSRESFYERYFLSSGAVPEVVYGVRDILEHHLETDLSRLSAEDDFSTNLKFFFAQDSLVDVDIVMSLEKRFGIKIADDEAANMKTVRDIVNLVSGKLAGA